MSTRLFLIVIVVAFVIKFFLFGYMVQNAPEAKYKNDSHMYHDTGVVLLTQGRFATVDDDGILRPNTFRTPGYPLFLGTLTQVFKLNHNGVVVVQIFLTFLAAYITFLSANQINPQLAPLSGWIVLWDPPITLYSLMILTESLFLLLMTIFLYLMIRYLKTKDLRWLLCTALILTAAAYVRPASFFLFIFTAVFILYANWREKPKRAIGHAVLLVVIVFSSLSIWLVRNHNLIGTYEFSTVRRASIGPDGTGLFGAHPNLNDERSAGWVSPYKEVQLIIRSLGELMLTPGSFKDFNSQRLKATGKVFGYPWMCFWLIGLLVGLTQIKKNLFFQFMAVVMFYFIGVSICGALLHASPRFRVPMMPFIAIFSSWGWMELSMKYKKYLEVPNTGEGLE